MRRCHCTSQSRQDPRASTSASCLHDYSLDQIASRRLSSPAANAAEICCTELVRQLTIQNRDDPKQNSCVALHDANFGLLTGVFWVYGWHTHGPAPYCREAFAAWVPGWGVPLSYGVAITYVLVDTFDKYSRACKQARMELKSIDLDPSVDEARCAAPSQLRPPVIPPLPCHGRTQCLYHLSTPVSRGWGVAGILLSAR